jgi:hypothetical protein
MTDILEDATFPFDACGTMYLRLAFMTYWRDAPPSAEVFYLPGIAIRLSVDSISELETLAQEALVKHNGQGRGVKPIFLGHSLIEMTDTDVMAHGWRVLALPADTADFG